MQVIYYAVTLATLIIAGTFIMYFTEATCTASATVSATIALAEADDLIGQSAASIMA
jgi:hypothetical protein